MTRFAAKAVLIDLDGTLLDTVADLAAAANAMRADLGLEPLSVEQLGTFIGKGAEMLVHRAVAGHIEGRVDDEELWQRAMQSFLRHYERENGLSAALFPEVREGLEAMRERALRLAVVTNKPRAFTEPLLERTGLAEFFDVVVSGDTVERKKPDPLPMLHACERLGVRPSEALAIGDSVNDALAARAAGIPVLTVPYGYNEGADVRSLDVDGIVDSLLEAARLIR